jgi:glucose-6-phosphate isomerase
MTVAPLRKQAAWKALEAHHQKIQGIHLRQLFAEDARRGERMATEAVGIYLDYSKNRIIDQTLVLLLQLAAESGLRERIDAMFSGEKINVSEQRAVLHVALRAPPSASIFVDSNNVVSECMPTWTKWPTSPIASAAASGKAIPASGSVM